MSPCFKTPAVTALLPGLKVIWLVRKKGGAGGVGVGVGGVEDE